MLLRGESDGSKTPLNVLLIGPYDPNSGEYTFLAPPLGVWRLAGALESSGLNVTVFDPNCCDEPVRDALTNALEQRPFDIIGSSTTGMTLKFDLALVHLAKRVSPKSLLVGGGMEATFNPDRLFSLAPFDLLVLGEGEKPMRDIARRMENGEPLRGIPGTAFVDDRNRIHRLPRAVLDGEELHAAIQKIPYDRMPYSRYWDRLERAYRVGSLPFKAEREARLSEVRSARLITLNYCPMGCTFCSSTNFLHAAQGKTARIARLDAEETLEMVRKIVSVVPGVRTVIFQDDIFVFRKDGRILPLCEGILRAKRDGDLPEDLEFISTNRIDAMTPERLALMRRAGFRVLGFGVESFSVSVLEEFRKAQIAPFIAPVLRESLQLGITPFLDIILTSPRSVVSNFVDTLRQAYRWIEAGCEVGMYPYVIPFSGAAMANDQTHLPVTVRNRQHIEGTDVSWEQPAKILPHDLQMREIISDVERTFERNLGLVQEHAAHVPSRVRSLLWIASAIPSLHFAGVEQRGMPPLDAVYDSLVGMLALPLPEDSDQLRQSLSEAARRAA